MKILTAAEMREVDRLTIERGIPGIVLMENAGSRVVDFLRETFVPLIEQRVVVVCGKGNNGGDGFVVARQLFTRKLCRELTVIELFEPNLLTGDAKANRQMLEACGCPVGKLPRELPAAAVVVDAVLGTGLAGAANGAALDGIRFINRFPQAKVVAVDIPSGLPSDATNPTGEFVHADYTVTFTAAKRSQVLSPTYELMGRLVVVPIGSPEEFCRTNPSLTEPSDIRHLFAPRQRDSNKGLYGHVLVVGGSPGKTGAPIMTGLASYRSGAGLVTVACPPGGFVPPVLMMEPMDQVPELLKRMSLLAIGPGLGTSAEWVRSVKSLYDEAEVPAVIDADALNCLALSGGVPKTDKIRILTPHPGEMSRLTGKSTKDIQADRMTAAQELAAKTGATVVLKGDRTVIAFADGETWVNPTGSPALAKGGTGDILTGMIAGMVAQHTDDWQRAVVAAVWLHGRAGELAGEKWGEQSTIATDLLDYVPEAMNEVRPRV